MKSLLVTGGTGSFGQAFVKRMLATKVPRIVIYSRGEHAQEEMQKSLKIHEDRLRFFIGDVRDGDRLHYAFRDIDVVVHAAAMKIVPLAEYNPTECVATNVIGAENVVKAAINEGVRTVVALSTDKAVNPINLYGATKLAAEKIFIAANALSAGRCSFCCVRYGNVINSRGSVIPLFRKQVAANKLPTVTHADMTRFWITMDRAIDMVITAIHKNKGRVIYVPKIPSMRITDLAKALCDKGYEVTGIRPGEKISECLITEDEARYTSNCGGYYLIQPMAENITSAVPAGFRYDSESNGEWMTVEQLRAIIGD